MKPDSLALDTIFWLDNRFIFYNNCGAKRTKEDPGTCSLCNTCSYIYTGFRHYLDEPFGYRNTTHMLWTVRNPVQIEFLPCTQSLKLRTIGLISYKGEGASFCTDTLRHGRVQARTQVHVYAQTHAYAHNFAVYISAPLKIKMTIL